MGKSSGNQKVTQQTKLPSWYSSAAQNAIKQAETAANNLARPYMGNTVAGMDPLQQQAINATGQNIGSTNLGFGQAQAGAQSVMGYNPQMVSSGFNPAAVQAGVQDYSYNPGMVGGGSFLQGDINAYMDPYVQNVERQAMSRLEDQRLMAQNANAEMAVKSGAFGGSRHGIREALTDAESNRAAGELSANLRSQAFNSGAGLMQQDMARGLQAQLANQQAGMQNAQFGANVGMQNIANNMNAQQFNANMGMSAAQMAQQAALANQSAGLQGAQLNLAGAQQLGALTEAGQQSYLQGLQAALAAGQLNQDQAQALLAQDAARYDANRNYPLEQMNIRLAALGGTQVPTSSTTTRPTTGNFLTGAAGGALAGMPFGPIGIIGGGLLGGLASM